MKAVEYETVYVTSDLPKHTLSTVNKVSADNRADFEKVAQGNANDLLKYNGIVGKPHKMKRFINIPANGRPAGEHLSADQITAEDKAFLAEPAESTLQSLVRRLTGKERQNRPVRQNRPSRKPADPQASQHADMGAQVDRFEREEAAACKGAGWDPRNIDRAVARENEKHMAQMGTMKRLDESLSKILPTEKIKDRIKDEISME